MSRAARVSALVAVAVLLLVPAVQAYLKLGARAGGRIISIRWDRPVQYFVTNRDVDGVTAAQLQTVVHRAFGTWEGVPTASFAFQFAGFTNAEPLAEDDISVIGFRSRPDLERTLGATIFRIDELTGRILESDIFLNSHFPWSVASGGQPSRFDVESISVHEIGHLLGLGHSALGETEALSTGGRRVLAKRAVMFPIAFPSGNIADRSLQPDDVAGISDIYPSSGFTGDTGAISGRVRLGGSGVFGAHITAFNPATGLLVGGFSLDSQGSFVIGGLTPGLYVVRVEPLDDADIDSFFDDDEGVNINFRPTYYSRLVPVPAGGSSGTIEISVQAK